MKYAAKGPNMIACTMCETLLLLFYFLFFIEEPQVQNHTPPPQGHTKGSKTVLPATMVSRFTIKIIQLKYTDATPPKCKHSNTIRVQNRNSIARNSTKKNPQQGINNLH